MGRQCSRALRWLSPGLAGEPLIARTILYGGAVAQASSAFELWTEDRNRNRNRNSPEGAEELVRSPMVASENLPSATSAAMLAPISTEQPQPAHDGIYLSE